MSLLPCSLVLGMFLLVLTSSAAFAGPYFERQLRPGEYIPSVRSIACNTRAQLDSILSAYSVSYQNGKATFKASRRATEFDVAAGQIAPVCLELWFFAIIPIRTISSAPYRVISADGSVHRLHIIEAIPVGPDGLPAEASYYLSSRWRVAFGDTAL